MFCLVRLLKHNLEVLLLRCHISVFFNAKHVLQYETGGYHNCKRVVNYHHQTIFFFHFR